MTQILNPEKLTYEQRAEVLENAARALEVFGFATGTLMKRSADGWTVEPMCALGAIGYALGYDAEALQEDTAAIYHNAAYVWGWDNDWYEDSDDGRYNWDPQDFVPGFNDSSEDAERVKFILRWRAQELRDGKVGVVR